VKAGWVAGTVEDLCEVEYGTRVVQKRDGGSQYPVYGGGGATFAMDAFNREDRVVIARFGMSELCTRFVTGKFFLNDSGLTLRPRSPARLLPEFVNMWCFATNDRIFALGKGAAQKNLDVPAFRALDVAYPVSIAEQRRIVALLDEAFVGIAKARANAEKNIENARAVFESHLNHTFSKSEGWVAETLGDCCEMYQPKTIGTKDLVEGGPYPVFGANGVIGRYNKYNHEEPQLLVTCRGATCGAVNVSEPFSWITGNAMVVRPKDQRIDIGFLEFAFRGGIDLAPAITGAAQPQITRTNLSPLILRRPRDAAEQALLAARFRAARDMTDDLSRVHGRKLSALDELKKSLLHHAFAGEL
jgi:restriction endonuclease S subunit